MHHSTYKKHVRDNLRYLKVVGSGDVQKFILIRDMMKRIKPEMYPLPPAPVLAVPSLEEILGG